LRLRFAPASEEPVREGVRRFLGQLLARHAPAERRHHARLPFPMLVRLTPVDPRTMQPIAEPITVVGKNLSEEGLGFYHQEPLPYRRAVITLEDNAGRSVSLLIDLSWCRFTRQGWYDSGGRFLEIIEPVRCA
jgi:hypothetical protein